MIRKIIVITISFLILAPQAFATSKAKKEAIFIKSDKNKNNELSQKEFKGFIQALARAGNARANYAVRSSIYGQAFRVLDKDKSGSISLSEAKKGT